ncbi:MAG: PKD domain-containing protein, partial [Candidatus Aenigmatarchaeota archaeon]
SIHFSSVYAADLFKEWKCGSGLTCGSDCQGSSYKSIGGTNDPEFAFSAEAGIYNCEVNIKNCCYGFTGDTPQLNEYSDVYLNDLLIGNTDDLFCNSAPPPNGNGPPPNGGPCDCDCGVCECGVRASGVDTANVGVCDDAPLIIDDGESIELNMDECRSDGYGFIKSGGNRPRCQDWDFSGDPYNPPGDIGGTIIEKYIGGDCDGTLTVNLGPGSYTIGTWAPTTAQPWSRLNWCKVPEGDGDGCTPACGTGEVCCDGICYSGDCCTAADCPTIELCIDHYCEIPCAPKGHDCTDRDCCEPWECGDGVCGLPIYAGESEMETENIHFSFEFVYIILVLLVGSMFAWIFLIRKNLTYLYQLFKMNVGKTVLILVIAFVLMFSVHFSSVYAADLFKEWKCGSGLTCGSSCQGNPYKSIGGTNDPQFTFSAEAGIYNCDLSVKNTWFAFTGTTPQLNEYSDVYINGVNVGHTDDLFCNAVTGNGEGCSLGLGPAACNAIPECEYQYYMWYNVSQKGRCAGRNCAPYPHSCGGAGGCEVGRNNEGSNYWQTYFWTYFGSDQQCTGIHDNCCSCWTHGAWCGGCDPSRPVDQVCRVKSPKYCGDLHYNERYCEQVVPGSGVQCEWDHNHNVMVNENRGRKAEHTSGVPCSQLTIKDELRPIEYTKYNGIIGFHHFATDQYDTDFICCFAKSGTLIEGMHCVRNEECKNNNCDMTTHTCGGVGGNQAPDPPTIVNSKTTCPVDAEGSDRCGFRVSATDPDENQVRYHFDWDDGETTHTVWVDSGEARWKRHIYTSAGTFTVKIKTEDANGAFSSEISGSVIVTSDETHWRCFGPICEEVLAPGEDECTPETELEDCGIEFAGGSESEGESVYFGLTFNGFNGNVKDGIGADGTTLSFASGCEYCGDVIKTIHVTGTELKASGNKIKLDAQQSHGLRSVSITCTKLDPPVADAGPDQT